MTLRGHKGPRLFVEDLRALLISSNAPTLPAEASHYLRDVLRVACDDSLELADPRDGFTCYATVSALSPLVVINPVETIEGPEQLHQTPLILLMALCKGQKNELLCDWATELGCTHIAFWQATRSIVRVKNEAEAKSKELRFNKVALAAAQQSRQPQPPRVSVSLSLKEALALLPLGPGRVCCSLAPHTALLDSLASALSFQDGAIVAIGPEGDFTPEEEELLTSSGGFTRASLGRSILRSELAAVTALTSVAFKRS